MAGPCACQSFYQKPPFTGKNELAEAALKAFTNDSGIPTCTLTLSRILTLTPALPSALANLMVMHSKEDFQQILKTVLEAKTPAPAPQPLVFLDGSCEKPLQA